jgi:hypothetical protein
MMKVACRCGAQIDAPALETDVERVVLCDRCRTRTRLVRRADGKVHATRLAPPEARVRCGCGESFLAVAPDAGGTVRCPRCGRAFELRREVRQAGFTGVAAAPGRNQDRAAWHAASGVGCVADGVTASPRSAEAAELACRQAPSLFEGPGGPEGALRAISGQLLTLRAALVARPLTAGEVAAAGGDARQAAAARLAAYQTTLAAFRVGPAREAGRVRALDLVVCGDSGVVAVGPEGAPVAAGVRTEPDAPAGGHVLFPPRTGGTHCLPDSVPAAEWRRTEVAAAAWIVAGTDGFFGAFAGSRELLAWLERGRPALASPEGRPALLAALHAKLEAARGGDDDIAFVIVPPA